MSSINPQPRSMLVATTPSNAKVAPTELEKALLNYMASLDEAVKQLSKQVDIYRAVVAHNQFDVFKLEHIFEWAMGGQGVITLTGRINQLCVFDRLTYTVPTTTTSLQIKLGRDNIPLSFASGSPFSGSLLIQHILGGADTITATITPIPVAVSGANTPQWAFGLFGHKTGNTQEI